MALPRKDSTYEEYTEQLVYFSARLHANPETTPVALDVDDLLEELDRDQLALCEARREEMRTRALRDYQDRVAKEQIRRYHRRIGGVIGNDHFVIARLFPRGLNHIIAGRGRTQIERLDKLIQDTDDILLSPRLAADPDAAELTAVLVAGRAHLQQSALALQARVDAWEQQKLAVTRAQDRFNFRRASGVDRLGVVLGQLRAILGGSLRAAYKYTQPGPGRATPAAGTPAEDDSG